MTVSIVCNTFNHEKYVRDALESFVTQKVNFNIEILVYDDASTDKTADIIREYEKKYPDIIKPVYQTVNQYSLRKRPSLQNLSRATGKYVAICEGDDYWIDPYKLQKQVDYMEKNEKCTFCFTNGRIRYGTNENLSEKQIVPWDRTAVLKKDFDYDIGEVEKMGFIPTCSFLFRNGLELLNVSEQAFKGDIYLKLSFTKYGYAHFIDEPMVVYRRGVNESATALWVKDPKKYAVHCDKYIRLFEDVRDIIDKKHEPVMNMRICQWKILKYYSLNDYDELKKLRKSGEIKNLKYGNLYSRIFYASKDIFPKLLRFIHKFVSSR